MHEVAVQISAKSYPALSTPLVTVAVGAGGLLVASEVAAGVAAGTTFVD